MKRWIVEERSRSVEHLNENQRATANPDGTKGTCLVWTEETDHDRHCLAVGKAIEQAAELLPPGWRIKIEVERHAGTIELYGPYSASPEDIGDGDSMAGDIEDAVAHAVSASPAAEDD